MRRLSIAVAAISAIAFAQVASAADLPRKAPAAPPPAPVFGWTGFYAGLNVGYGWGSADIDSYSANDPAMVAWFNAFGTPPLMALKPSGVLGGLQLGYNWQLGSNWLVGLETDFNWSDINGSSSVGGLIAGVVPFSVTAEDRVKWFGTVRARLGYLPVDKLLAYVTGGFAYGRVQQAATYVNNSAGVFFSSSGSYSFQCNSGQTCLAGSSSTTATGWTLGGGLEYAIWQRWTLRAEYLHISLSSRSVTETALMIGNPGDVAPSFNANFSRTTFNVTRVGANYRF